MSFFQRAPNHRDRLIGVGFSQLGAAGFGEGRSAAASVTHRDRNEPARRDSCPESGASETSSRAILLAA